MDGRAARLIAALAIGLVLPGCASTSQQAAADENAKTLTAGVVQREIRIGMAGDEVAKALGSPNIVTTDADRNQVWIYDRISSTVSSSSSSAYGTLLLIGGSSQSSSREKSQSTFTVVIKFDDANKVKDFSYHASKF